MQTVLGLDLAQAQDYTALAVLTETFWFAPERRWASYTALTPAEQERARLYLPKWRAEAPGPAHVHCSHLQRWPLGTSYPQIAGDVCGLMRLPQLRGATLVVDATGVGRAVVDLLRPRVAALIDVTITSGASESSGGGTWGVPKKDLIGACQVLLQQGRLKISSALPEAATLVSELQSYRVKITQAAHETFNARDGAHDDLVLALALAAWWVVRESL